MAVIEVATTGRTITITPQDGATPGTPAYTQEQAAKLKASGAAVLLNQISWVMSGCIRGTYVLVSGSGSMFASAVATKSVSKMPMRKNDTGNCSGSLVNTVTPYDTSTCHCQFKISDAGQTKVKCS